MKKFVMFALFVVGFVAFGIPNVSAANCDPNSPDYRGALECLTMENPGYEEFRVGRYQNTGVPDSTLGGIIAGVLTWGLYILGFLAILGFVVSGIYYIMAAGDEDMAKKGKTGMVNSIIGVIVALLGFIVLKTVEALLKGDPSGLGM